MSMFRSPSPEPVAADEVGTRVPVDDPIPLSVLSLDLDQPPEGWSIYLAARDIEIVVDDIGRLAITRSDARQLFVERRELEARAAEQRARLEQRAIEADQQRRAQLPRGLPWYEIPAGLTPAMAMVAPELAARPRRESVLDHALSNSGGFTYHELPRGEE